MSFLFFDPTSLTWYAAFNIYNDKYKKCNLCLYVKLINPLTNFSQILKGELSRTITGKFYGLLV